MVDLHYRVVQYLIRGTVHAIGANASRDYDWSFIMRPPNTVDTMDTSVVKVKYLYCLSPDLGRLTCGLISGVCRTRNIAHMLVVIGAD